MRDSILNTLRSGSSGSLMELSDELGCPMFVCDDLTEVPADFECDFFADCPDGSDEVGCPDLFVCDNGERIPEAFSCDGDPVPDCADGSDEVDCGGMICI